MTAAASCFQQVTVVPTTPFDQISGRILVVLSLALTAAFVITSWTRTTGSRLAKRSGHVSALLMRTCVSGFVRTQALISRLELSSRSRSARSAWERASCPYKVKKHRTDHVP